MGYEKPFKWLTRRRKYVLSKINYLSIYTVVYVDIVSEEKEMSNMVNIR